jgi:O-glycosyl hydrolase
LNCLKNIQQKQPITNKNMFKKIKNNIKFKLLLISSLLVIVTSVSIGFGISYFNSNREEKSASASGNFNVDINQTFQTIEGMGGFGGKRPWWNSQNPAAFYDDAWIAKLKDMGVTVVRDAIHPSFEEPNENSDPNFLELDKVNYTNRVYGDSQVNVHIPYLKRLNQENIKIIVSVWSAPRWLKVNNSIAETCPSSNNRCSNANFDGQNRSTNRIKDDPASLAEFAERIAAYLKIMEREGVEIYGLSIANEPLFNQWFESSSYNADLYAKAFNAVATRLDREGLDTKLFGIENMAGQGFFGTTTESFLEKLNTDYPEAMKRLHAIAVHGYGSNAVTAQPGTSRDFAFHKNLGLRYGGKKIWMTEQSNSNDGEWDRTAYPAAKSLLGSVRDGDLSLNTWWYWDNGIFDSNLNPKKLYHTLKQFYRYLQPGDVRVAANSPFSDVAAIALKSADGAKLKLVFNNDSTSTRTVDFSNFSNGLPRNFSGFYTTSSVDFQPISGNGTINLPPKSIVSLEGALTTTSPISTPASSSRSSSRSSTPPPQSSSSSRSSTPPQSSSSSRSSSSSSSRSSTPASSSSPATNNLNSFFIPNDSATISPNPISNKANVSGLAIFGRANHTLTVKNNDRLVPNNATAECKFRIKFVGSDGTGTNGWSLTSRLRPNLNGGSLTNDGYFTNSYDRNNGCSMSLPAGSQTFTDYDIEVKITNSNNQTFERSDKFNMLIGAFAKVKVGGSVL